jgi:putative transposase
VRWLFHLHQGRYGSPRLTAELRARGWSVSKNTVAAVMAELGLTARRRRQRRGLTKADKAAAKPPDLVGRRFAPPEAPDRLWVGDLTEIPNGQGRLYLASVLDLHSRRIVGFALGPRHNPALATAALKAAIAARGGDVEGVVLHTDQGGEYTAAAFAETCRRAGVLQSMGRTGSALDNAVIESWHSTLEFELLAHNEFTARAQAKTAVAGYIDWYNTKRRHSTCGGLSPAAYEHQARPARNRPEGHPDKDTTRETAHAAAHSSGPGAGPGTPRTIRGRPSRVKDRSAAA